jgi:hypothetical protein
MLLILGLLKLYHQRSEELRSFLKIVIHSKDQLDYLETIDKVDAEDLFYR